MSSSHKLEVVVIPTGRVVTQQTAWWYNNSPFEFRDKLYCVHNRNLLESCNSCRDTIDEKGE